MIHFFLEKMAQHPEHEAFVSDQTKATYADITQKVEQFTAWLSEHGIASGSVVSFDGDYSANAIALLLALAKNKNIIVPLSSDSRYNFAEFPLVQTCCRL